MAYQIRKSGLGSSSEQNEERNIEYSTAPPPKIERWHALMLGITSAVLVGMSLCRAISCWSTDAFLDHVSGAWLALAVDLKEGIFYRPIFGPHGFGGTRFFPLYFSFHAVGLKLFGNWRITGYVLSGLSIFLLVAGVFVLLRRLGANRLLAFAGASSVLAALSVQQAMLTIREDGMAAMLNVWGLAVCAREELKARHLFAAAALFTLAFATKETTIFGVAAVFLALFFAGRSRTAWKLAALTAAGYMLVLSVMYFGSHGRVVQIFKLTATAGAGFGNIWNTPSVFMGTITENAGELLFFGLGLAALIATPIRKISGLAPIAFLTTAAVTSLIFHSPGTTKNHLIDLHVVSIVLFVTWIARDKKRLEFGVAALIAVNLILAFFIWDQHETLDSYPIRAESEHIVQSMPEDRGLVLAENPMLAVMAGQSPYVLDPFMFRVIQEKEPSFAEPLWRGLREKRFSAVLLLMDPNSEEGQQWYSETHFGKGFVENLDQNYKRVLVGDQFIYVPR